MSVELFEQYRPLLFAMAYRMLGTVTEAEDAALIRDGGGQRGAAIRPLRGQEAVVAFIQGTYRLSPPTTQYELTMLNGQRAILARTAEGRPFFAPFLHAEGGVVHSMYVIAGRKLAGLTAVPL
ncbi:MAG: hypothetical protein KJ069_02790 [Anaerolineae bacterium]|nr:hypothetical protein [Anaerolineae bacterium]